MEVESPCGNVELVQDPEVSYTKLKLRAIDQALVRERFEASAHFVDLTLNYLADVWSQIVERVGERGRPDL